MGAVRCDVCELKCNCEITVVNKIYTKKRSIAHASVCEIKWSDRNNQRKMYSARQNEEREKKKIYASMNFALNVVFVVSFLFFLLSSFQSNNYTCRLDSNTPVSRKKRGIILFGMSWRWIGSSEEKNHNDNVFCIWF